MASNLDISRDFLEGAWNRRDMSVIDKYVDPNCINHDPTGDVIGIEGSKAFVKTFTTAFPDVRCTIHNAWEDGDTVTLEVSFNGTHQGELMGVPATGNKVNVDVTITDRHENGKIVESWGEWDPNDMMQQLGVSG
jgi:predicted ester cyclase